MNIHFVTGGARSGKSRYAEQLALTLAGDGPVTYIATAVASDEEMISRIALHRSRRSGMWRTIEAPTAAGAALIQANSRVILLDCLTLLTSNVFLAAAESGEAACRAAVLGVVRELLVTAASLPGELIGVSKEVGWGMVPDTEYGRWFRDVLGEANQVVANAAVTVTLLVAGCALQMKPAAAPQQVAPQTLA